MNKLTLQPRQRNRVALQSKEEEQQQLPQLLMNKRDSISHRSMSLTIESPRNIEGRFIRKNIDNSVVDSEMFKINNNDYSTITMEGINSNPREIPQINFKTDLVNNNPLSQRDPDQQFVSQNMMIAIMNNSDTSKLANQIINSQTIIEGSQKPQKSKTPPQPSKPKIDFSFCVSLAVNSKQIQQVFFSLAKKRGFLVLESGADESILAKKEHKSVVKWICSLLWKKKIEESPPPTLVKMRIENDTRKCLKVVYVSRICGTSKCSLGLINAFKKQIHNIMRKDLFLSGPQSSSVSSTNSPRNNKNGYEQQIDEEIVLYDSAFLAQKSKQFLVLDIKTKPADYITNSQNSQNNLEEQVSPFELESTSYFMFYRILCAQNYGIGQKVKEFIQEFQKIYCNPQIHLSRIVDPIESVQLFMDETITYLFSDFNYGRSDTSKVMPFCRIAVELYLYSKVHVHIFQIYKLAFYQEQERLDQALLKIREQGSTFEIISQRPEFKKYADLNVTEIVFNLERIAETVAPSQQIKFISLAINNTKIAFLEKQANRQPLEENLLKQDEMYLLIMSIIMSSCSQFAIRVFLLFDIVMRDTYFTQLEQKNIHSLKACLMYILKTY